MNHQENILLKKIEALEATIRNYEKVTDNEPVKYEPLFPESNVEDEFFTMDEENIKTFLYGPRNGIHKVYHENGLLRYDGEWKDGLYHGDGKLYTPDGILKYDGEFGNNKFNGYGKLYSPYGILLYHGDFENGAMLGEGLLYYPDGSLRYGGELKYGTMHGEGKEYNDNGKIKYIGHWVNGYRHGDGKSYFPDGNTKYEGPWVNGFPPLKQVKMRYKVLRSKKSELQLPEKEEYNFIKKYLSSIEQK